MLQLLHVTSAPSSRSVSISTAVWIVMCKQPAMRAPRSGFVRPYFSRNAISPGISFSARSISLRPHSARRSSLAGEQSITLHGNFVSTFDTGFSDLQRHQPRHLVLGQIDFLAAPLGQTLELGW